MNCRFPTRGGSEACHAATVVAAALAGAGGLVDGGVRAAARFDGVPDVRVAHGVSDQCAAVVQHGDAAQLLFDLLRLASSAFDALIQIVDGAAARSADSRAVRRDLRILTSVFQWIPQLTAHAPLASAFDEHQPSDLCPLIRIHTHFCLCLLFSRHAGFWLVPSEFKPSQGRGRHVF